MMYNTLHKIMCIYRSYYAPRIENTSESDPCTKPVERQEKKLSLRWDSNPEHHTSITEVMGSNPNEASEFFPGLFPQLL